MTMIERVAEALLNSYRKRAGWPASKLINMRPHDRQDWIDLASSAIEAMREPTPAMVDAGVAYVLSNEPKDAGSWSAFVVMTHGQMTEAALNEQVAK
jgi:hypothetical protein